VAIGTETSDSNDYVGILVARLKKLQAASDPRAGASTSVGKDGRAFDALETAGELVRVLAGWAISHTIGLGKKGLDFVPMQPSQTKRRAEYRDARAKVDLHEHETVGAKAHDIRDPRLARKVLINLLQANSGGWPYDFRWRVISALEDLDFGVISPIFEPRKARRKVARSELSFHLQAVCFVEYRTAAGMKKLTALEIVADTFGVGTETIRSWEKRLCSALGHLEVSRSIAFARNHAKNAERRRGNGALLYGDVALHRAGTEYQALRKAKKQ
jgi:hypothetical protein